MGGKPVAFVVDGVDFFGGDVGDGFGTGERGQVVGGTVFVVVLPGDAGVGGATGVAGDVFVAVSFPREGEGEGALEGGEGDWWLVFRDPWLVYGVGWADTGVGWADTGV